jgi:hypothetical protein
VTPEQEEQVRRALAVAAGATSPTPDAHQDDAPIPPEVAARLDRVLDELVAPRREPVGSTAIHTGEPAMRRRGPRVLVAAAAAVIVLAGASVLARGLGSGESSTDSTTAGSQSRTRSSPQTGAASGDAAAPGAPGQRRSMAEAAEPESSLRSATLARDLQRLVDRRAEPTGGGPSASSTGPVTPPTIRGTWSTCSAPTVRPGEQLLAVHLDGHRASLVLSAPTGDRSLARVYACAQPGTPVATASVRTP